MVSVRKGGPNTWYLYNWNRNPLNCGFRIQIKSSMLNFRNLFCIVPILDPFWLSIFHEFMAHRKAIHILKTIIWINQSTTNLFVGDFLNSVYHLAASPQQTDWKAIFWFLIGAESEFLTLNLLFGCFHMWVCGILTPFIELRLGTSQNHRNESSVIGPSG